MKQEKKYQQKMPQGCVTTGTRSHADWAISGNSNELMSTYNKESKIRQTKGLETYSFTCHRQLLWGYKWLLYQCCTPLIWMYCNVVHFKWFYSSYCWLWGTFGRHFRNGSIFIILQVIPLFYKVMSQKDEAMHQELRKQIMRFDSELAERKTKFFGGKDLALAAL